MDSILSTIKKMLGLDIDYDVFDTDVIVSINAALMTLNQLGVGPSEGFLISGPEDTWFDFVGDRKDLEAIKSYVYIKARLLFDPPTNSFLVSSLEKQAEEFAWRINVQAETPRYEGQNGSDEEDDS